MGCKYSFIRVVGWMVSIHVLGREAVGQGGGVQFGYGTLFGIRPRSGSLILLVGPHLGAGSI